MNRLIEKVAIITGGALGIGRAAALQLAREGAFVYVTDILDEEGVKVRDEIVSEGNEADFVHLDVSSEKEVKKVFSSVQKEKSHIDILVNNAGISGVNKPTHEIEESEWTKVMDINEKGVFLCTKHVIPFMKKQKKGSIINLSSIYGIISAPDIPPYHASKGAVRLMTKTDALLYAKEGIRVNSVHPGFIWTPLVEEMAKDSGEGITEFRKKLESKHPLGHIGEPEDIAHGIVYLASDEAKFLTGTELVIDGGYTCQ
jgi:NAD(P)-dependent dehydrogenase (short-subunit alcohol dehydrogenase family)